MAEEKTDQNAQMAQTLFNKGFATFERGNLDIAIDLLLRCVELTPDFTRARRFLRAAEMQKAKRNPRSGLSSKLDELTTLPAYLTATLLFRSGKLEQALLAAEKLLKQNPLLKRSLYLLVDIAIAAGHTDAAILTLEAAAEQMPDDLDLIDHLGDTHMKGEEFGKARDCYSRVLAGRPTDGAVLRKLKDAEAHFSMKQGGWENAAGKVGGFNELKRDQKQAAELDIKAKAQTGASDAEILIAEMRAKIAVEPANLNYYRGLSRLFIQQKRYPEGIEILEQAAQRGGADPEIDRSLTAARVLDYTARIEALRKQGDAAGADLLETERDQFVFDDLVARVGRYPNDLRLRYELGVLYYQNNAPDEAIQQLQLAQRSPRERADALYYLSRCFRAKGQADMALMQLETALELLPIMDDSRKKALFELGEIYETTGDIEKAFNCYREVYSADIAYLDIGAKMERIYKARQQSNKP